MIETGDAIAHVHRQDQQGGRVVRAARPRHAPRADPAGPARRRDARRRRLHATTSRSSREQHDVDAQEVRRYFSFDEVRQGLLDVTGRLFGLAYSAVDVADLARRRHVVRRVAGRRADRPDPPRPPPAPEQVQPRRAVHAHRRRDRPPAARGRAGLQLPARPDGARRRRHPVPRVRPPDPPRPRRPPALGAVRRGRHRVGLRRGAVAAARGVGLGRERARGLRHRRGRHADPGRPGRPDARGRGLRQGPAGAHADVLRRRLLPVPPGGAGRRRGDRSRCRARCRRRTRC